MQSFMPRVDSGQLKAQLNKIMASVNAVTSDTSISAKSTEEAGQCIVEFTSFFVTCAERHGTTPHAILGQHVVTNVFIFVLESIVKPNLTAYCRVAEKHAANARDGAPSGRRGDAATSSSLPSAGRRDALEARRRRLRTDIIRPFIQLFQGLHTSLISEGEPLAAQESGGGRAGWERTVDQASNAGQTRRGDNLQSSYGSRSASGFPAGLSGTDAAKESYVAVSGATAATSASHHADALGDNDDDDVVCGDLTRSLSRAPLLWKNASPLNILCNHILEVLESQWLVAVVGADYASLLLEVLRWAGYARLITPAYLVRMSSCLVGLLERVPQGEQLPTEDGTSNAAVAPNVVLQDVSDGQIWVAAPTADDGCVYAQVLVRLYSLSQITAAYPPFAAPRESGGEYGGISRASTNDSDALRLVRRLIDLVKARHRNPTPDLRLEAYCVAALRQLSSCFPYDHPAVARAPVEVVKLLCDFFFLPHHTPRHDVWRLEVMQLIAVVLCYVLSDLVGEELWKDLHAADAMQHAGQDNQSSRGRKEEERRRGGVEPTPVQREVLTLLHHTVFPTMQRVFTQHRHEYSFTSRRELFSFPCSPLQEVFDFGAVVLYLCSVTHTTFTDVGTPEATGRRDVDTEHGNNEEEEEEGSNGTRPRKRQRESASTERNEKGGGEGGAQHNEEGANDGSDRMAGQSSFLPHPVQVVCETLTNEFFQPAASPLSASSTSTRRRSGAAPLMLRIRTAGIRTNSAAVQDVVSDTSLFLLHLIAQPCATLRCPHHITDAFVEDVLLPLSAAFGLRMGPLLMATLQAVVPHCSTATQGIVFATLAQRALPSRIPGAGQASMAPSLREDLLNPSETVYRVLVMLLERRLCAGQFWVAPSPSEQRQRKAVKADDSAPYLLEDVCVAWETHLHVVVQRISSQLHTLEQAVLRLCDAMASTNAANDGGHNGADALHPLAAGDGSVNVPASSARVSASPLLTFAPIMSPALAVLLTRFALLVQSVRLQQLTGAQPTRDRSGVVDDGAGLSFVLNAAAQGVSFYAGVPILGSQDAATATAARVVDSSDDRGPTRIAGGGDPFHREGHHPKGTTGPTLSFASVTLASGNTSGPAFLSLFSSSEFLAWLDVAETYACAVLWAHRSQDQLNQVAQLQSHRSGELREGVDVAPSVTGGEGVHGPLRNGVMSHVGAVCADLRRIFSDVAGNVPAVLHDATEGQWMLRPSLRGRSRPSTTHTSSSGAGDESEDRGHNTRRETLSLLTHDTACPPPPRSFQVALSASAQTVVTWLMRRARLLDCLSAQATTQVRASALAPGSDPNPFSIATGNALSPPPASERSSAALLLSVQCVQLLHLLLRWRRAGLWFPPEEHVDSVPGGSESKVETGGADAAEGEESRAAAAPSSSSATSAAVAGRADVRILGSSPRLFDSPTSMLERFSVRGGGRLYYAVLWLCHHITLQLPRSTILASLPLWVALRTLYRDVGAVLLDSSLICVDPRQTVLQFTTAVAQTCFLDGLVPLSQWRPSNPNSREASRTVSVAFTLSLDALRAISVAARRTGAEAYAATPLMDVEAIRRAALDLLTQQALAEVTLESAGAAAGQPGELEDTLLSTQHPLVAQKYPCLPPVLPALPALLRLLFAIRPVERSKGRGRATPSTSVAHTAQVCGELGDCRTMVRLLQMLFARYRYHAGPALCSELLVGTLSELERRLFHPRFNAIRGTAESFRSSDALDAAAVSLVYTQCGRLLEIWTAQLTDVGRVDMPVCTPQWQCALLRSAFTVLARCEPAVAEALGRFSFEFLSESTPYVVRRHAALHAGVLFRTFTARRAQVLHTLLTKAREGMLSPTTMLCATSLLALSEAVRAAPELLVDVLYTLLECWATRGFAQRGLVAECMTRLTSWVVEEAKAAAASVSTLGVTHLPSSFSLEYTRLCRIHVRPLLFLWLCEYGHPLVALPVVCFGYSTLTEFVVDQLPVLLPLALLLLTASSDAESTALPDVRPRRTGPECGAPVGSSTTTTSAASTQGSLFQQLLHIYTEEVLLRLVSKGEDCTGGRSRNAKDRGAAAKTSALNEVASSVKAEELRQLAPLCLVLRYLPQVVAQLLVVASNAPVPLFGAEAYELGVEAEGGGARSTGNTAADWSRRPSHGQGHGRGSRRSSGGGGHPSTQGEEVHWCGAAQRCLYWFEALVNTCEETALVQAGAYVWLGKFLPADACVLLDVSPAAGAALLSPVTSKNAVEVLVFYLQRLAVWPTTRPVFDVILSAHIDAVVAELVGLHRTLDEPQRLVYATPEQLRRALTWIAGKAVKVPLIQDAPALTSASASKTVDDNDPRRQARDVDADDEEEAITIVVDDAQDVDGAARVWDSASWQACCLELLVPPLVVEETASPCADGAVRGSPCEPADALSHHDALSRLFLLGRGTFLQSLTQIISRSCVAPTSLEGIFRGPQQLSLLTHVATRWCSSRVLANAAALHILLTSLLHWLHPGVPAQARRVVCGALLHVWPVAVSNARGAAPINAEEDWPPKRGSTLSTFCKISPLTTCAVLLANAMEPQTLVSSVVASTWKALCRSDPQLRWFEWHRRAAVYRHYSCDVDLHKGGAAKDSERDEAMRGHQATATREVVVVDAASTDDESEAEAEGEVPFSERLNQLEMCAWSWSTYLLHRAVCLAPLRRKAARRSLSMLLALLNHLSGCAEEDMDPSLSARKDASTGKPYSSRGSSWPPEGGVWSPDVAVTTAALSPPPAPFLRDVTAGVDSTRTLVTRCIEIASMLQREGTPVLSKATSGPRDAGQSTKAAPSVKEGAALSMSSAEMMAVAVGDAVLRAVVQLYRWSMTMGLNEAATTTAATTGEGEELLADLDSGDEHALACFRLLRSLCLCVLHAGEATVLSSLIGKNGSLSSDDACSMTAAALLGGDANRSAEQLIASSLGQAYMRQLCELEQLSRCADARLSEVAVNVTRTWALCLKMSTQLPTSSALTTFDAAVMEVMCGAYGAHENGTGERTASEQLQASTAVKDASAPARALHARSAYGPRLVQRLSWAVRSVGRVAPSAFGGEPPCLPLPLCNASYLKPSSLAFSPVHLAHDSVWQPLRRSSSLNERMFLPRFVASLAFTYGLVKKSSLWDALLPLLYAEERYADNEESARATCPFPSPSAHLLSPLFLHVMCLRESDGQRVVRREWSEMVDKYVVGQARRCPRTARLFLHALYDCHVVLMRHTRQRGVKGATATSKSSAGAAENSSRKAGTTSGSGEGVSDMDDGPRWPGAFGAVPTLQDMQECYWLSNIPALHLARAAVAVQEPHLALFFAQLSGESLFGPRTGCAALCGEAETTRTAVMLREGTVGSPGATGIPYSVLFPYAKSEDFAGGGASGRQPKDFAARSGARARERQDTVRQQTLGFMRGIFGIYEAVQRDTDVDDVCGISVMMRGAKGRVSNGDAAACNSGDEEDGGFTAIPIIHSGRNRAARDTIDGTVIRRRASPRPSTEDRADGADETWVSELRDLEEEEEQQQQQAMVVRGPTAGVQNERSGVRDDGKTSTHCGDPWRPALHRAAQMLERGLPSTAIDILLSLTVREREARTLSESSTLSSVAATEWGFDEQQRAASQVVRLSASTGAVGDVTDSKRATLGARATWTVRHEACLRSLLAEAAWRSAQWSHVSTLSLPAPPSSLADSDVDDNGVAHLSHQHHHRRGSGEPCGSVARAALHRLARSPFAATSLRDSANGGFYEHLLNAFVALTGGTPLQCLPHLRAAEAALRLRLSASTFVSTVIAAEALNEVRQCAYVLRQAARGSIGAGSAPPSVLSAGAVALPLWLTSDDDAAQPCVSDLSRQMSAASSQLLDSVRLALSQVYGSREGWYGFLLGATERALAFHNPGLAHRWLSDWERHAQRWRAAPGGKDNAVDVEDGNDGDPCLPSLLIEQRHIDITLRKAQVDYALGRWPEALALLQPSAAATPVHGSSGLSSSMPLEPRVVQQLMLWHAELQLVPSSHLVRDAFLSRAAASDVTGACSFLLARLCHTLASDIAGRLTSHEHRQLEESVEGSKRLRKELESQLHAATHAASPASTTRPAQPPSSARGAAQHVGDGAGGAATVLSDEQLRLLRRRIRELAGDVKRLEEEWRTERMNYDLYRRSAINAYSRFLQLHRMASSTPASTARPAHAQQQPQQRGVRGGPTPLPRVSCVPQDGEENTVHAVFGFVELWLNVADVEQSREEVLSKVLDKAVERIPSAVFLPLANQLTAQLGSPYDAARLQYLVGRIAHDYPLHIVWPLLALRHGHTFAKSREVNTMHSVDEAKIRAAQELLADLAAPSTSSPQVAQQVQHAQLLSSAYLELAYDRNASAAQVDKRYAIKSDFALLKEAVHLTIPPPTSLSLLSPYATAVDAEAVQGGARGRGSSGTVVPAASPNILRYRPHFTTPGGVNVPKVLLCELSDGQVVRQLLKAGDDLRQDALIEQVFATANQLFQRRAATQPLRIRTFNIVPLAPTAGILQWVEHTIPLGEYLTGRYSGKEEHPGAHERYFPGEPTTRECRVQLHNATSSTKAEVLLRLYEAFTPALHYFFLEHFTSAQAFVQRQQTFTRSVATSSMVGYIVGLGDRHINNILLHQQTAEVVHIDLGIAFDQNKLLPVPELVPFRMTRNIIDGLGVRGTEGSLRPCAEAALGLLREKRSLLHTLLNSIMHDPLARWAVGAQPNEDATAARHAQAEEENSEVLQRQQQASTRQVPPMRARASNADAARTLARIDAKLRGYDGGDVLSVATHVAKLVAEAQRVECLAEMFPGWSQWV